MSERNVVNESWSYTLKGGSTYGAIYCDGKQHSVFSNERDGLCFSKRQEVPENVVCHINRRLKHETWKSELKKEMNDTPGNGVSIDKLKNLTEEQVKELVNHYPDHIQVRYGKIFM